MKRFLIAAAASLFIFGGQVDVEASTVENLDVPGVETQEVKKHGKWAHFRDKYLLGRETENERRDRENWERRYRDDYRRQPPPPPPPPPPRYGRDGRRDGHRYNPPPPPPPPRHGGHRDYGY